MAVRVHRSPFPSVQVPDVDISTFLFGSSGFRNAVAEGRSALIDAVSGEKIAFADLESRAHSLAAGLHRRLNFRKWDVLAVFSPNSIHYSTLINGTLMAGGTFTGVNPTYTVDELVYQLRESGASVLVAAKDFVSSARKAGAIAGIPSDRIFVLDKEPVEGVRSVFDLFVHNGTAPKISFSVEELHSKPAFLAFSSGTTGLSKGAILTHRNIVANILQTKLIEDHSNIQNDVWVGVLPFYHVYALNLVLHMAPLKGVPVIVISKFDFVLLLETIQKYKVRSAHLVPPIILHLAKHPIVSKYDLSSLYRICSGAAPLGSDLANETVKRLKCLVTQGYGLTETSPVANLTPLDDIVSGSVGILAPNMEARVVDVETGRDCDFGEPGELWLRGPNVMKGYLNKPDATAEVIDSDGYFHTGDIAVVSLRNHFFIVDRLKELIKYKGLQVPPAELEAQLLTHPSIADAAVIPRPDQAAGELPCAYVVLQPNAKLAESEVQKYVADRVAPHKRLRGGVVFVDAIPKAASGKILRRILRKMDEELLSKQKNVSKSKL